MKKILFLLLLLPGMALSQENPNIRFHHNGDGLFALEVEANNNSTIDFDFGDNILDIFKTQTPGDELLYIGKYKDNKKTLLKLNGKTPEGPISSSIVLDFKNKIFTQDEIVSDLPFLWEDATGEEKKEISPWWINIFPLFLVIIGIIIIIIGYRWSKKERDGNEFLPDNFWDDNEKQEDIISVSDKKNTDLPFEVVEKN